jgi:hypothetical protein
MCACALNVCLCLPHGCVGTPVARRGPAVFKARPATGGRPRVRVALVPSGGRSSALAAGVTWTSRTTSAPWAARRYHTSVIAAGAIYVIGGYNYGIGGSGPLAYYQDVWASTDGGANRTRSRVLKGGLGGYHGMLRGTRAVPRGSKRFLVVSRLLEGYL